MVRIANWTEAEIWETPYEERLAARPPPQTSGPHHEPVCVSHSQDDRWQWACRVCGLRTRSRQELDKGLCKGLARRWTKVHASHDLWMVQDVVICAGCCGLGETQFQKLLAPCTATTSRTGKQRWQRAMAGRHPITGDALGPPLRLQRDAVAV